MMAFHDLFPEIEFKETRTATVFGGYKRLPPDSYAFLELYCVDAKCDCRRVMINVLPKRRGEHVATINHAFEPPAADDPVLEQTFLDPLNRQSRFSSGLIELFEEVLRRDEAYRRRLERHYRMVKDALADPAHPIHAIVASIAAAGTNFPANIDPYAPCPCGSGKKYKWCCREKARSKI